MATSREPHFSLLVRDTSIERQCNMRARQREINRRSFLRLAGASLGATALAPAAFSASLEKAGSQSAGGRKPAIRVEPDSQQALIRVLSWDTEGGGKTRTNLLR